MIIIRNKQVESIQDAAAQNFYIQLLAHIKDFFPGKTKNKSDLQLLEYLKVCIQKAKEFKLDKEKDFYTFVNICMVSGNDFDEDDSKQWMIEYLQDKEVSSPSVRVNRLFKEILYRIELKENKAKIKKQFYK